MNAPRRGWPLDWLRYVWPSPCTLIGLLLVGPLLLAGGTARRVDGVVEVAPRDPSRLRRWLPFNAIACGHLVFGLTPAELDRLRRHEHAHVRQYERWGPLFFLAYPIASLLAWRRGGHYYRDNVFEVEAREAAAR